MNIHRIAVGPLQTNAYIVADPATKHAVVIDPGDEADKLRAQVQRQGLHVDAVLLTHGHWDHIGAVDIFDAPVYLHPADNGLLGDVKAGRGQDAVAPAGRRTVRPLADGERVAIGAEKIEVIHTPGHTAGSVCLLIGNVLFSGDTLFCQGVGRTDLPGGSAAQLVRSLRDRLFILPGDVRVLPGHGPETTIGAERGDG